MDWAAIMSFFAGLAGGYTLKTIVTIKSNKNTGNASATGESTIQTDNVAGESIAGRDIRNNSK